MHAIDEDRGGHTCRLVKRAGPSTKILDVSFPANHNVEYVLIS